MHLTGNLPAITPEAAAALAKLLIRLAEQRREQETDPEPIGELAPRAVAEIVRRKESKT